MARCKLEAGNPCAGGMKESMNGLALTEAYKKGICVGGLYYIYMTK
jgi:NOL1/NOP2/fmu family ribosome biogenesis protein